MTAARRGQTWTLSTPAGTTTNTNPPKNLKIDQFAGEGTLSPLGGRGHVHVCPRLGTWFSSLGERHLRISVIPKAGPRLDGNPNRITRHDTDQLTRHRHALTIAANGTHPVWWTHVLGRPTGPLTIDDIPWQCATCANPDVWLLDDGLLPWCQEHTHGL